MLSRRVLQSRFKSSFSGAPRIPHDPRDQSDFDLFLGFVVGFVMGYTMRK